MLRHKTTIQLLSALALIALGCGLLTAAFVMQPPGEIHNSVLIAFGEILTFAGALFGIDYRYRASNQPSQ
ncbi:MAG: hypothetical protein K2O10_05100 [Muribaculaceae bacterium]|nr:hypothetical protein [Muribaculaceae bacterium]